MKKIGIIGGLGPEATIDYYREIIGWFNARSTSLNYPDIIIYSVNISEMLELIDNNMDEKAIRMVVSKIKALERAGAEFTILTANTPHKFFSEIQSQIKIPMLSIIESVCSRVKKLGLKKPGLIGTRFTMESDFYQKVFYREGIELVVPESYDIELIHEKIFSEIELGIFKDTTRDLILDIIEGMLKTRKIDSLILGCTEFPLLFKEPSYLGIPFLNTTRIHVEDTIQYCLASEK